MLTSSISSVGGGAVVVIASDQPPVNSPQSPLRSSTTYRFQVPFAFVPLKTDRGTLPLGAGAGAGNVSAPPWFVGLNDPVVNTVLSGNSAAAWSSIVSVTPLTSVVPPASDMTIASAPVGPTSRRSRSSASVWVRPVSVTLTSVTVTPLGPA